MGGKKRGGESYQPDPLYTDSILTFLIDENSWPDLQQMLTKVGCGSGCRVVIRQCRTGKSTFRKKTYELRCSHGIIMTNKGSLLFIDDNLGPINVPKERLKCVKSIGAARGNYHLLC